MYINWKDITDNSLVDTTLHALKIAVQAGTVVIGKVRLVTADGDEITNDTLDTVKISQATHDNLNLNANLQIGDADLGNTNPAPVRERTYTVWASGSLAGNVAATQMPSVACIWVVFKAAADNAGKVYIGITGVTALVDQTTNTTCGFQLSAGEETPPLAVANLNVFYRICTNAGDDLTYLAAVS